MNYSTCTYISSLQFIEFIYKGCYIEVCSFLHTNDNISTAISKLALVRTTYSHIGLCRQRNVLPSQVFYCYFDNLVVDLSNFNYSSVLSFTRLAHNYWRNKHLILKTNDKMFTVYFQLISSQFTFF